MPSCLSVFIAVKRRRQLLNWGGGLQFQRVSPLSSDGEHGGLQDS